MKKSLLVALFATIASIYILEGQEQYVQCPVTHATLFNQGAQLIGETEVSITPGRWDLVAAGLTPHIIPGSIQVRGEGSFTIMGVTHRNNWLENPEESSVAVGLREKIELLQRNIEDENSSIDVLLEKESFLKANYDVVSGREAITPDQFSTMIDLYNSNMESVKSAILKKKRTINEYQREKEKLERQFTGAVDRSRMPTGEVVVTVMADKAETGKLWLSYMVRNAWWSPSYDIRVDDISGPASIVYKANIWQNSGVDWKDVKISLSNAAPMTAGILPELTPWFIDYYNPPLAMRGVSTLKAAAAPSRAGRDTDKEYMDMVQEEVAAETPLMPVAVTQSNTSFSFEVEIPKTITSGGKPETVELQRLTVPATYSYASTPKLNPSAFLMGYITGWEQYNLLPGESNIYFGNTFTGNGYIDTAGLTDSLKVSLGADNTITVKREKRGAFSSRRLIGTNKQETISYLITVRNNKASAIEMRLLDQMPLSKNRDITVEAVELSGGIHDPVTGEVVWNLSLEPRSAREILFTYSIRLPKNKSVNIN